MRKNPYAIARGDWRTGSIGPGAKEVHSLEDQVFKWRGWEVTRLRTADLSPVLRGWGESPIRRLFAQFARSGALGLVRLLCPSLSLLLRRGRAFVKAGCGKTARPV